MTNAFFLIGSKTEKNGYSLFRARKAMILGMWNEVAYLKVLFSPNKQSTITMTMANLIINSFQSKIKVNWELTFSKLINKMAQEKGIYASRGCPLMPWAMHIYSHKECFVEAKKKMYSDKSNLQMFNFDDAITGNMIAKVVKEGTWPMRLPRIRPLTMPQSQTRQKKRKKKVISVQQMMSDHPNL